MSTIRLCLDEDNAAILAIVNAAVKVYRGVIPGDVWHEPYMPRRELETEIESGVTFWGYETDGSLVGIMGIQPVRDVDLIRHAYVLPGSQHCGIGTALLGHLESLSTRCMLVGTWAATDWAIRFYRQNGFELVSKSARPRFSRSTGPSQTARSSLCRARQTAAQRCSWPMTGTQGTQAPQILATMRRQPFKKTVH